MWFTKLYTFYNNGTYADSYNYKQVQTKITDIRLYNFDYSPYLPINFDWQSNVWSSTCLFKFLQ